MRRLSLLVVLLALPAMGQGILYRPGGGQCGANMSCTAEDFTASTGTGPGFAVTSQVSCAVDLGPGAADCIGTNASGYVVFSGSAVVDIGDTRLQSAQVVITNGYLTLNNSGIRRLDGSATPVEGGIRFDRLALGTCASGREAELRADVLAGAMTGNATRLCICMGDGAGTYHWFNLRTGTEGTTTTCPD